MSKIILWVAWLFISVAVALYVQLLQADVALARAEVVRASEALSAKSGELERLRDERDAESAARERYLNQLRVAKNEIENLRADLADGKRRLYVNAVCPAGVPEAEGTGRVTPPAAVLTADAERRYLRLLDDLQAVEAWAAFCHSTLLAWGYVE